MEGGRASGSAAVMGAVFCLCAHAKSIDDKGSDFVGFANDQRKGELDRLARLAISLVTSIAPRDVPPREIERLRSGYQYEILFDNRVDAGESHFAAVAVLLVVCYLHGAFVHAAIERAVSGGRRLDPEGEAWVSVLAATGQPPRMV